MVGVHILSVVERSSLVSQSRGRAKTPILKVNMYYIYIDMAIYPTGGVFSLFTPPPGSRVRRLVGHSTCMSVLARRRAIMGSIVQPKRSCLGAATCWSQYMQARRRAMCWGFRCTPPAVAAPRQGRLG